MRFREVGRLRVLEALLLALIFANAGGILLQSILDPDLFWHLKTGEWIWEHKALPGEYLFAIAPQDTPVGMQRFVMTQYWLSQVVLHLAAAAGGMGAIVAVRWLLFALLMVPLFLRRRARGDFLVFLCLLLFAVAALMPFPLERPQYFSFAFAGILLWLLEGFRAEQSRAALRSRAAAVPLLMLVWAQCHGGFVIGVGFLGLVLLAESLKQAHPRLGPLPRDRWLVMLASGCAGMLASGLNPNGTYVFRAAGLPAWQQALVTEYLSTIDKFRLTGDPGVLAYWLLLGLTAAGLALSWRKADLSTLALAAVAGYFSFMHVRFIPFFLVIAVPAACRALSAPWLLRWTRPVLVTTAVGAGVFMLKDAVPRYGEIPRLGVVNSRFFPVAAADFVAREGLRGNVFNLYEWGGYLYWRLDPAKVFIDGRNADPGRSRTYLMVLTGLPGQWGTLWKSTFAASGVRLAVTDYFDPDTGELRGLVSTLLAEPGWAPVFASPAGVVFAEVSPENRDIVRRNAYSKERFCALLVRYCSEIIESEPRYAQAYVARGDLLLRLGDRTAALRSYLAALEVAPDHRLARRRASALMAQGVR